MVGGVADAAWAGSEAVHCCWAMTKAGRSGLLLPASASRMPEAGVAKGTKVRRLLTWKTSSTSVGLLQPGSSSLSRTR